MQAGEFRCGLCQGNVSAHGLSASEKYPAGEAQCPHCGARVARLDHASWRSGLRVSFLVLGAISGVLALREWPNGTWWPFALTFVGSIASLGYLRLQFRKAQSVLLPVMRY